MLPSHLLFNLRWVFEILWNSRKVPGVGAMLYFCCGFWKTKGFPDEFQAFFFIIFQVRNIFLQHRICESIPLPVGWQGAADWTHQFSLSKSTTFSAIHVKTLEQFWNDDPLSSLLLNETPLTDYFICVITLFLIIRFNFIFFYWIDVKCPIVYRGV